MRRNLNILFRQRNNNYWNRIKPDYHKKLLPARITFPLRKKHYFNSQAKFTITERIELYTKDKLRKIVEPEDK